MSEVDYTVTLPTRTSANFWSFSPKDLKLTFFMGIIALIGWVLTSIMAVLPIVLIWALLMIRSNKARTYVRISKRFKGAWRRRVKKGAVYVRDSGHDVSRDRTPPDGSSAEALEPELPVTSDFKSDADITDGDKADRKKPSKRQQAKERRQQEEERVIDFVTASVPDSKSGNGQIGFFHHYPTKLDIIPIYGEGSTISTMGPAGQQWAHRSIAALIKALPAIGKSVSVTVSFVNRFDPADVHGYLSGVEEVNNPHALTAPTAVQTPLERRWQTIYEVQQALAQEFVPLTAEPWMVMLIGVRQEGVLAKASSSRVIGTKWIGRLLINKAVQVAVAQLANAGVTDPRPLDLAEINDFVRGAHPGGIDAYYEQRDLNPEERYSENFTGHWPQEEMRVTNEYAVTDGVFSTVLRVTGFPKTVGQGFFRELDRLIDLPCFSRATVGEAVQSNSEVWWLERGTAILSDLGNIIGIDRQTLASQERDRRLEERKLDIHASNYSQQFSHLYAIFALSPEELDDYVERVLTELSKQGVSAERIIGAEYQYPALWSATLGLPNV